MVLLPLAGALLHLVGVRRTRGLFGKFENLLLVKKKTAKKTTEQNSVDTAQQLARMVNIAANRSLYQADCLKKSIVLEFLLNRRWIECNLKIGVKAGSGKPQAHAWIESGGTVIGDSATIRDVFHVLC
jgi:hypothetical protein